MESFFSSSGVVALAEIGEITQLATIALSAHYPEFWSVTVSATLGMMIANVPAVLATSGGCDGCR